MRSSEKVGGGEKQTDFVSIKTFSSVFLLNQPERVISERESERVTDEFQNGGGCSHKYIHSNIYKIL